MSETAVPDSNLSVSSLGAVILAGGKAKPDMQALTGQTSRALVEVNGKTLLAHVTDALRAASLTRLVVVGDVPASDAYAGIPDQGDFVANLFAGVDAHPSAAWVLIATSDLPFLTGPAVADFIEKGLRLAHSSQADIVFPIVPVAACYARFPGVKRTALKLREGEFTGGNLALARPELLRAQRARIGGAYAARKSPLRLAQMLGLGTIVRLLYSQQFAPRSLPLSYLEAKISGLLGSAGRAVVSDYPEIATDLDRPSDFAAVGLTPPVAPDGEAGTRA